MVKESETLIQYSVLFGLFQQPRRNKYFQRDYEYEDRRTLDLTVALR